MAEVKSKIREKVSEDLKKRGSPGKLSFFLDNQFELDKQAAEGMENVRKQLLYVI